MAASASKSKKASGANSTSTPPPEITLYLDKCLGRNIVACVLRDLGYRVEIHTDHFDEATPDSEWLPKVGEKSWIVLTKDNKIHQNQVEIAALLKSGTATFVLRSKNATGSEMATAFATAMPTIERFLAKFDKPFVATITLSGNVTILCTQSELIKKIE